MTPNGDINDRDVRFRMPADLWDALEKIAGREDRSVSWLIRQACTDYVRKDARAVERAKQKRRPETT